MMYCLYFTHCFFIVTCGTAIIASLAQNFNENSLMENVSHSQPKIVWNPAVEKSVADLHPMMHVVVVVCGTDDRVEEALVNIKSILMFSKKMIKFHIFTEENHKDKFKTSLKELPPRIQSKFIYEMYSITYPDDGNTEQWRMLFKLCASQRLFLPQIMKNVDSILYVDSDILFLNSIDHLWNFFAEFNSTHISAMAPDHEQKNISWYGQFARHPYYGVNGMNSGMLLMNLSRIRNQRFKNDLQQEPLSWNEMLLPLYHKYKLNLTFGDQDLLNIIFHYNPELLFTFSCDWNYRPDHCMHLPVPVCETANANGVNVMHGCQRTFHTDDKPSFKAVYQAFKSFNFEKDLSTFLQDIQMNLNKVKDTNCKKSSSALVKGLKNRLHLKEEL